MSWNPYQHYRVVRAQAWLAKMAACVVNTAATCVSFAACLLHGFTRTLLTRLAGMGADWLYYVFWHTICKLMAPQRQV
jgi:hypothetical protein